ncbi:MAG: YihY/virulence factor BrkB family protein [Thermoanaerobaculia bacterium]
MKKYFDLFQQTFREFLDDKAPRLGAALSYYTIFSIAPLLLIAVAIAGFVFGHEAVQGQLTQQLTGIFGEVTAKALEEMVKSAAKPRTGVLATIVGVITLLLGASGVFGQLKDALNTIWNVEAKESGGFAGMIRVRFLSMAMVFGTGFLLLVSLVLDTVISAAYERFTNHSTAAILQIFQLLISFGIITVLFSAIFRYLPDIRVPWRDVWLGGAFTAFLFVLGKFGLALYISKAAPGSSYGAAGSLVVLLVWIYWSAQILFFGAEFTQVYARSHGSMQAEGPKAKRPTEPRRPAALHPATAPTPEKAGGGTVNVLAGGAAGCLVGLFAGLIGGVIASFKTIWKILTF